jgi:hypothetical protein
MSKTLCYAPALSLLIASCKKTSSPSGGSWTVNSTGYQAVTCQSLIPGSLDAATANYSTGSATASDLVVQFYTNALPTTAGTYTVITNDSALFAPTQVQIVTTIGGISGTSYASTGSGSGQTVNVTVSGGKVSIAGSGINMSNCTSSATLSLNITQLQ